MPETLTFAEIENLYHPAEGPVGAIPSEVQVAIVGAGPVGLFLAAVLGKAGISVVLLEKSRTTSEQPRAIMVDDEFMRALDSVGAMSTFKEHVTVPIGIHFLSPFGFALARVPGFVTPNGFGARCAMAQPVLEKVLLTHLEAFPSVAVRFRAEGADLVQTERGVSLMIKDADDHVAAVRADYVLACDGAHSFVRKRLDIPFEGHRIDEPHLVVDLAEFPDQVNHMKFMCNPKRPVNSIPAPYGGRRIEFMLSPGDQPADIVSPASIRRLVETFTPYRGVDLKIIRAAVYGFSERIAGRLRDGRVFLLGDAAHIMPPFGGQGLNTGARDVANLAWKIVAVLRGEADARILDSYDAERRSIIEQIVSFAGRVGRVTNMRSRPLAWLRDAGFAIGNLFPAVRRYFDEGRYVPRPAYRNGLFVHHGDSEHSMTGRMFPRPMLRTGDGRIVNFDSVAGSGFAVVGVNVDPAVLSEAARDPLWARLKAPVIAIRFAGPVAPGADGVVATVLAEPDRPSPIKGQAGKVMIVRPDRYVALTADPAEFPALSAQFAAMLAGG